MLRIVLLFLLNGFFVHLSAQDMSAASSTMATVNVTVTDMKDAVSAGEQIVFAAEKSRKIFTGKSDKAGKFTLQLPAGDRYVISVKSLTDTSKYGLIDIPALGPDQYFTDPFTVAVRFEAARSYTLNNVHFDVNKATLRPDSFKELDELVAYLKNKEQVRIEIGGHTDNSGKDDSNLKLSQQRATTIRNYLLKKGITGGRVEAKGYGASQPVADNDSPEGRQLNRRTEVRIL